MDKKTNLFGNNPIIPENPFQFHNNIFDNNNQRIHPSLINKKGISNPKTFVKKPNDFLKESINMNLFPYNESNNETKSTTNNKNEIIINNVYNNNPDSSVKNNKNINIYNNMNQNGEIRNPFKNKNNKDNNSINNNKDNNKINIIDEKKDNNKKNLYKKEKKNLVKSVMMPNEMNNESKVKTKKKEKLDNKKEQENEKNKAEIMDQLKCYICMAKLTKPRMCKYCHRPACENCIKIWLNEKHQCGFCRKRINFNETIEIPIINDIAEFFMKNINNQKEQVNNKNNDKENNENNNKIFDTYLEIPKLNLKEEDICPKHKNKYEYFCYQCNEKYCDKCLVICNDSSKIHEDHLIIRLDQLEKNRNRINETMEEFQKLKQTNLEIDHLIKLYELKIRELEIEKNNFISEIDLIKEEKNKDINNNIHSLSDNYNIIRSKNDEIANSIDTTPMALQNIIAFKDHGQGKQIYEHLLSLNEYAKNNNLINLNEEKLYIDTFVSDVIEITIPKDKNPKLEFNKQINNLIPNYDMKINFENKAQNIHLEINLKKNIVINFGKEKILCFIIFKNKNYGCEFIKMKQDQIKKQNEIRLYSSISTSVFFSFKDENNKISYKLYFIVYKL